MRILKSERTRVSVAILMVVHLVVMMSMVSFASGVNYAENAVKFGLDQAFWVVLAITAFSTIGSLVKRATSGVIISLLTGSILCYLCKNPEVISNLGDKLGSIVFGG